MNNFQQYRLAAKEEDFFRIKGILKDLNSGLNTIKILLDRAGAYNNYSYQQLKTVKEQDILKLLKTCIAKTKNVDWLGIKAHETEFDYRELSKCVSVHHLINFKNDYARRLSDVDGNSIGFFMHQQLNKTCYPNDPFYMIEVYGLLFLFSPFKYEKDRN